MRVKMMSLREIGLDMWQMWCRIASRGRQNQRRRIYSPNQRTLDLQSLRRMNTQEETEEAKPEERHQPLL